MATTLKKFEGVCGVSPEEVANGYIAPAHFAGNSQIG
jgi:hypothetical protein